MTTNAQGLTFGEWLARAGVSPEKLSSFDHGIVEALRYDWKEGGKPSDSQWRTRPNLCNWNL